MSLSARLVEGVVQILVAVPLFGIVLGVSAGHLLDQLVTLKLLVDVRDLTVKSVARLCICLLCFFILYFYGISRQMVCIRIAVEVLRFH